MFSDSFLKNYEDKECNSLKIAESLTNQDPTFIIDLNSKLSLIKWERNIVTYNWNYTAPLHFIVLSEDCYTNRLYNLKSEMAFIPYKNQVIG